MIGSEQFGVWVRWRESSLATDVRVRNVVRDKRIRLSGGIPSRRMNYCVHL
jgi:hypothetical protein